MSLGLNPLAWLLRRSAIQNRIRDMVVSRAAKGMAPGQHAFETGDDVGKTMFVAPPFAVYIHFPFCASACNYCIFQKTLNTDRIGQYVEAVKGEIDLYARQPHLKGRTVSAVHLGGGTPSLIPPEKLGEILARLENSFGFAADAQVTLEGNPESIERESVPAYRSAGIDRVSIGVQTLNDHLLRKMGRTHTAAMALHKIRGMLDAGFDNVSVDLIYGVEGQRKSDFLKDVKTIAELGVPHISAFPLIEKGVRTRGRREHRHTHERRREIYCDLVDLLESEGYTQYGVEDFAKSTANENKYQTEAWRFPKKEVVAVGAAGIGTVNRRFYSNLPHLDDYFQRIADEKLPIARVSRVSKHQEMRRSVLLGTKFIHVERKAFFDTFGIELEAAMEPLLSRLRYAGVWTVDKAGIHLTRGGMQVISEIWAKLVLSNIADAAGTSPPASAGHQPADGKSA